LDFSLFYHNLITSIQTGLKQINIMIKEAKIQIKAVAFRMNPGAKAIPAASCKGYNLTVNEKPDVIRLLPDSVRVK